MLHRKLTLIVLSLLAQLLIMDSDCWNLVPPIPMTSAMSWLTPITTWGNTHRDITTWLLLYVERYVTAMLHLEVCADERLASGVVEVALHEEVKQMSGVAADGAQFGVTALQDLITEGRAHIRTPLEKRAGKLNTNIRGNKSLIRNTSDRSQFYSHSDTEWQSKMQRI